MGAEMGREEKNRIIAADIEVGTIPPEIMASKSGLEAFEMMLRGEIPPPPMARTLNFVLTKATRGEVEFRGIPLYDFYNPGGAIHGGWPAAILDSALGCAIHTMIEPGTGFGTVELSVNLVRPIFEGTGEVICTAKVLHFGRQIATSEAKLVDAKGKLLAHGKTTCAVYALKPGR